MPEGRESNKTSHSSASKSSSRRFSSGRERLRKTLTSNANNSASRPSSNRFRNGRKRLSKTLNSNASNNASNRSTRDNSNSSSNSSRDTTNSSRNWNKDSNRNARSRNVRKTSRITRRPRTSQKTTSRTAASLRSGSSIFQGGHLLPANARFSFSLVLFFADETSLPLA